MGNAARSNGGQVVLGLVVMAMPSGCLSADSGHCIFNGGDASCSDRHCVATLEDNELRSSSNGCVDLAVEDESSLVRVPYGLVSAVRNDAGESSAILPQTVEDVVIRQIGAVTDACGLDDDELSMAVAGSAAIRHRLEHLGGVRRKNGELSRADEAVIEELNAQVEEVLRRCEDGGGSTGSSGSDTSIGDTSTGSSDTAGPLTCMEDADCTDVATPYCSADGVCVPCGDAPQPAEGRPAEGDAACAGADAERPFCVGDSCVPCREGATDVCDQQRLWCDLESNDCLPCTEHAQCTSGACELSLEVGQGRCFPLGTRVVTVDDVDTPSMDDFTSINAAVASFGMGEYGIVRVYELDGGFVYFGQVLVGQGKTIALLLAEDGETPVIQGTGMTNPGLRVETAGTRLYVDGLTISDSNVRGVIVDDALAWFDRSRIVGNAGGGIRAQNSAELTIRNSFVGGSVTNTIAIDVDASAATISYTTAISGFGASAQALSCFGGYDVRASDSIFLVEGTANPVDPMSCMMAVFDHNASEIDLPGGMAMGNANVGVFDDTSPWFGVGQVTAGNFSLTMAGGVAFAGIAEWNEGDPSTDILGTARPSVDPTPDYAGAHIP